MDAAGECLSEERESEREREGWSRCWREHHSADAEAPSPLNRQMARSVRHPVDSTSDKEEDGWCDEEAFLECAVPDGCEFCSCGRRVRKLEDGLS